MKKNKKQELDYKLIAIVCLAIAVVILTIWLIIATISAKQQVKSEMLSLKQINISEYKENNKVLGSYKAYKDFLKKYKVSGSLKRSDFNKNDYIISLQTYAKDFEYEKKKFSGISISDVNGIELTFDTYGYCDDVETVELIAYILPISKGNYAAASDVVNNYNFLEGTECIKEGE